MTTHIYLKTNLYSGPVSKHPRYSTWANIKDRCFNPNNKDYKWYGAIGITMLQEWAESAERFLIWIDENLGVRPEGYTLDRINPFGNYEPDNLRWANRQTQSTNIRDPEEWKRKQSESKTGENHPNFGKPSWNRGKKASPETRRKQSKSAKNRQKKTCPHCGRIIAVNMYARYHGNNCPQNPERNQENKT